MEYERWIVELMREEGKGEGAAEGEGGVGEVAGWSCVLGGNWKLAWGREGDVNGKDGVSACRWGTVSFVMFQWLDC